MRTQRTLRHSFDSLAGAPSPGHRGSRRCGSRGLAAHMFPRGGSKSERRCARCASVSIVWPARHRLAPRDSAAAGPVGSTPTCSHALGVRAKVGAHAAQQYRFFWPARHRMAPRDPAAAGPVGSPPTCSHATGVRAKVVNRGKPLPPPRWGLAARPLAPAPNMSHATGVRAKVVKRGEPLSPPRWGLAARPLAPAPTCPTLRE